MWCSRNSWYDLKKHWSENSRNILEKHITMFCHVLWNIQSHNIFNYVHFVQNYIYKKCEKYCNVLKSNTCYWFQKILNWNTMEQLISKLQSSIICRTMGNMGCTNRLSQLAYFELFYSILFHTHHSKLILEINCAYQVILIRSYLEILDSIAK